MTLLDTLVRRRARGPKIFLIGPNKCGTSTFHAFFEANRISSVHWDHGEVILAATMSINISKNRPVLRGIDQFTAYSDLCFHSWHAWIEAATFFREFHAEYPDAFFILNDRDTERWIASRRTHPDMLARALRFYGGTQDDVEARWRTFLEGHRRQALAYFAGNPRFLHFDIERDPPEKLVAFFAPAYRVDPAKFVRKKSSVEKGWRPA